MPQWTQARKFFSASARVRIGELLGAEVSAHQTPSHMRPGLNRRERIERGFHPLRELGATQSSGSKGGTEIAARISVACNRTTRDGAHIRARNRRRPKEGEPAKSAYHAWG